MRCFISVDLTEEIKEKVINLQKELKDVKLVGKENLHFTLKFLGEISEEMADKTRERLRLLASKTKSFEIDIAGLGTFPNDKFIRVLWLAANSREFINLHNSVDDVMADMLPKEKPIPHLTLARVQDSTSVTDFIANNRNVKIGKMVVDKIKLKKSTLTWQGPVYEDVEVFALL